MTFRQKQRLRIQHLPGVRRAWLLGDDPYSGKNYDHRKDWVKNRLIHLAANYGIDVLGYAVMGNHLHVILRNRPDVVKTWSDEEIARRIWFLFPKRKNKDGTPAEPEEHELQLLMASKKALLEIRTRLSDISWLMRQLAERIAVMANREDKCTGRFWEGRFKCQPLLDDAVILACAAYVDLNPVRAKMAETPEKSDFTSAQIRIKAAKAKKMKPVTPKGKAAKRRAIRQANWLAPVHLRDKQIGAVTSKNGQRASDKGFLPFKLAAYLKLLDWTGRQIAEGKRGRIPASCKPILERIGLNGSGWCELVENFSKLFKRFAGGQKSLSEKAEEYGTRQIPSRGGSEILQPNPG